MSRTTFTTSVYLLVNSCEDFTLIMASVSNFDIGNSQFHKTTTDSIINELGQVTHLSPVSAQKGTDCSVSFLRYG